MRIKDVTPENVFDVDPACSLDVTIDLETGVTRDARYGDWIRAVAALELGANVAASVRDAFAFARGGLCYAYWYAPLLTTAAHDVLRVADFASIEACRQREMRHHTMAARIAALVAARAIASDDALAWAAVRRARNAASHPASGRLYGFASALRTVASVRDLIDRIAWLA